MRELWRVLRPDGWAVLQSHIDQTREITLEDPHAITPEDRVHLFGQEDHLRIYGRDYMKRLREAGFSVTQDTFAQQLADETIEKFGLMKDEVLFICKKSLIS